MTYRSAFSLIPGIITDNLFSDRLDRMDRLFSRLTGDTPLSDSPCYNLIQIDDNHYSLTISVPGYKEKDLDITLQNGQLTITGKHECKNKGKNKEDRKNVRWLHKGFSSADQFSLSFNLHNRVKVQSAVLENGLLKLELEYEIPEEHKPHKITIDSPVKNSLMQDQQGLIKNK
ncbi:MAG: Hsp20 family protein [Candidatus Dasytiphilus stammeri]